MLERDVPFDVEREWEESRFARVYLEHTNQQSNIYFEQHQRERAQQTPQWQRSAVREPRASAFSFVWRFISISAFGGALLVAVVGAAWWWNGGVKIAPAFADARGVYEDILSAQQEFSELHFEQAMFSFHAAYERIVQRSQDSNALAAYAQGALASLLQRGEGGFVADVALEQGAYDAAEKLTQGVAPLFQISLASFFHIADTYEHEVAGELIGDALLAMRDAQGMLRKAHDAIIATGEREDSSIEMRERVAAFAPPLSLVSARTKQLIAQLKFAVWALGMERPRKFLVIAQDSAVARPTGGVIRSVGVITARAGAITDIVFDDVYGIDGQLQVNMVPPEPIQRSATAWALHDANWFLDFPLSAKKIAYFYGKSGGGDVDGVIALNEHAVQDVLALTGPVRGDNGALVNSENRERLTNKDVLRALTDVLPTLSGSNARALAQVFQEGLRKKDILVWLADRDYQDMIAEKGWSGEVIDEDGADYLAVVVSDIGGEAAHMKEDIWKETHIAENGDIINTVAVQFMPENGTTAHRERYVRIYVPAGAELLEISGLEAATIIPQIDYVKERFIVDEDLSASERASRVDDASGVRIFEESGKTVFGGWTTKEGKNATVIVRYRLPFAFTDDVAHAKMTFIFQKQPGVPAGIHFSLVPPEGMQAVDAEGGDLSQFFADGTTDVIIRATIK